MPYLSLKTNAKILEKEKLVNSLGEAIKVIGKSPAHFMVHIEEGASMFYAGTNDPCAIVEFALLGKSKTGYSDLSKIFTQLVSNASGASFDRIFIKINELDNWALGGYVL